MWAKKYRDYPIDRPLIKEQLQSGKGIIGCEMHDLNGWGSELHRGTAKKKSWWASRISSKEKTHG